MLEQNLGLDFLCLSENLRLRGVPPILLFATGHEAQGIPFTPANQRGCQLRFLPGLEQCGHTTAQFRKTRMTPGSPEPVGRISVIRFAAVKNSMQITAVRSLDALCNFVRRIKMIVPKQYQASNEFRRCSGQIGVSEEIGKPGVNFFDGQDTGPRAGPQLGEPGQ